MAEGIEFVRRALAKWHLDPRSDADGQLAQDAVLVTAEPLANARRHVQGPYEVAISYGPAWCG